VGRLKHMARVLWSFVFDHTVPLILKDQVKPQKLLISLVLSPLVLWFAKGSKQYLIQFLMSLKKISLESTKLPGYASPAPFSSDICWFAC